MDNWIIDALQYYDENYGMSICNSEFDDVVIGSPNKPRTCRFCGKTEPEVKFSNIAHAIPEFTGNHTIISHEECDNCNSYFAKTCEDNFSKYCLLHNTISRVEGKKKKDKGRIPTYKSQDGKTRIEATKNHMNIDITTTDGLSSVIDPINKIITIDTDCQPFIPRMAYKCLVKMALSLVDKDLLPNFKETIDWLLNNDINTTFMDESLYYVMESITPGIPVYQGCTNILMQRKQDKRVPFMQYITAFGNRTYQITIPCPKMDHSLGKDVKILPLPPPFMFHSKYEQFNKKFGNTIIKRRNFNSIETTKLKDTFSASFEKMNHFPNDIID